MARESGKRGIKQYKEELGMTLGEALLTPTKIYVKAILELLQNVEVKGISHITGGGFYENMPRMLRDNISIEIKKDSYPVPPIFKLIQKTGNIEERDMYNTFNMGIGMAVIVKKEETQKAIEILEKQGEKAYEIGEIVEMRQEGQVSIVSK